MAKWLNRIRKATGLNMKEKTMNGGYYQQGDVLLHRESIPKRKKLEATADPILQYGEHTGHKHKLMFMHDTRHGSSIAPSFKILTEKATGTRYLKVEEPADLVHEEHRTITIPPGEYRIGIVREYDHFKEEARQVID